MSVNGNCSNPADNPERDFNRLHPDDIRTSTSGNFSVEYDPQQRRHSRSWFTGKSSKSSKKDGGKDTSRERRFSSHLLNIRRKSSINFIPDNEGNSVFSNFKNIVSGRRRSSAASGVRRKSSAVISEEYEQFSFLPYEMQGRIPECIQKLAEVELGETPEKKSLLIVALREMIKERNENPSWKIDDDILVMFLRARKFDVTKAYNVMTNFYTYKSECYEVHTYTKSDFDEDGECDYIVISPQRDPMGRTVAITKLAEYDPDKCPILRTVNMRVSIFSKCLEDPINQITGLVLIIDCKNIPYRWIKYFNSTFLKCLSYGLDGFPIRYKAIHVLNENMFFKVGYKFSEPFLSQKIKNRIFLHGKNLNSLHQHVPPSILPREYGGTMEQWYPRKYKMEEIANTKLLS